MFGISLYYSSQFEQALQEFRQAREMAPRLLSAFVGVVEIYIVKEMFEEATIEINRGLKLFPKHTILLRQRAHIYAQKGEKDKTIEILDELLIRSEKEYVTPFAVASLYADMEEIEKAYEYLEEAYKNRDIWILYFSLCYHIDPRFNAFFKKIGL